MGIPDEILSANPWLNEWAILAAYRGSIAFGTYAPSSDPDAVSDKDALAVCVPPLEYYLGLEEFGSRGTKEIKHGEWDIVIYEARKYIRLLAKGNPDVLMTLWLDESNYLKLTPAGRLLIERRDAFAGRHVYKAFTQYAISQLHKMTHHATEKYMGEKRKRLVRYFGYDCKNAAHLIRLLRMGIEFLKEGRLRVKREDARQLLEIKRGEWTLEQVKAEADRGFAAAEQAFHASRLPPGPDMNAINQLAVEVIRLALGL
ncbi:MAG: nucleotidyltransferase domain-containing protein [Candidatus Sumerlaeota bacterium]|nr:nucleotidyltransferase domain-containing protein [Candidatus Sumerlaeota bacterium]